VSIALTVSVYHSQQEQQIITIVFAILASYGTLLLILAIVQLHLVGLKSDQLALAPLPQVQSFKAIVLIAQLSLMLLLLTLTILLVSAQFLTNGTGTP
jgi:NO-binding membrane sensor protein with MHYT domain